MATVFQLSSYPTFRTIPSAYHFSSPRVSQLCRPDTKRNLPGLFGGSLASGKVFGPQDTQNSGFFYLQIPNWKFQSSMMVSQKCVSVPQSFASGEYDGSESFSAHSVIPEAFSPSQIVSPSIRNFPWDKAHAGLRRRISDLLLTFWTWVALPILVVITINEIIFTVSVGKELFIPIGLLAGCVLAGILTETAIVLGSEFQESWIQWQLLGIALFFAFMKIAGMKCLRSSFWGSPFLVHFANGGLWQAVRFLVRWKSSKAEMPDNERVSSVGQRQA